MKHSTVKYCTTKHSTQKRFPTKHFMKKKNHHKSFFVNQNLSYKTFHLTQHLATKHLTRNFPSRNVSLQPILLQNLSQHFNLKRNYSYSSFCSIYKTRIDDKFQEKKNVSRERCEKKPRITKETPNNKGNFNIFISEFGRAHLFPEPTKM